MRSDKKTKHWDRQHGLRGDSSAEAVGMPGGTAEDVPVCLVLGTASVTVIEKRKNSKFLPSKSKDSLLYSWMTKSEPHSLHNRLGLPLCTVSFKRRWLLSFPNLLAPYSFSNFTIFPDCCGNTGNSTNMQLWGHMQFGNSPHVMKNQEKFHEVFFKSLD